ncbi:MAG: ABC transporter permease subunit [Chloroflexota bacterium]|nr:ABC transporter permease subunit [Chloroflexota bacterium]
MDNLMMAIGTQFIVIAVIFATMSLLLAERDGGTLAWTISKPVSRTSVLVSKWITSTLRHVGRGGRDPARGHHGPGERPLRDARHGDRGHSGVALLAVPALYVAIALAAATLVPSLTPFLPTSIFSWAIEATAGGSPSWATPIAWFAGMVALFLIARNRLDAMDL